MVAGEDGAEVQADDEEDEQEGGGKDHGFGGLGIGGLESEVVDMEAQVHEFALEVEERGEGVERESGGEFNDTHEHEGRYLAGAAGHGEDEAGENAGQGGGEDDTLDRLPFGGAAGEGGFAGAAGDGGEGFLGGDDDHGHGHEGEGEGGPEDAAGAKGGRGQAQGVEELVDGAAEKVDEEAEAEDAEDDGGYAGEVIDADAHGADEDALFGVFAQVDGREHAERGDGDAHEEGHDKGAEDGGEDAALGVGLAGFFAEEGPEAVGENAEAAEETEAVGVVVVDDLAGGGGAFDAVEGGVDEAVGGEAIAQGAGFEGECFVVGLEDGLIGIEGGEAGGIGGGEGEAGEADGVHAAVDLADEVTFDAANFAAEIGAFAEEAAESGGERGGIGRDGWGIGKFEPGGQEDGVTVFEAFGDDDVGRVAGGDDGGEVEELVAEAVNLLVADEELVFALDVLAGGGRGRRGRGW